MQVDKFRKYPFCFLHIPFLPNVCLNKHKHHRAPCYRTDNLPIGECKIWEHPHPFCVIHPVKQKQKLIKRKEEFLNLSSFNNTSQQETIFGNIKLHTNT